MLDEAQGLLKGVVALRRVLHRRPEVGLNLPATQRTVLDALAGLDIKIRLGDGLSSIVAVLEGRAPGPTVLLRADMDALPIQEATGLDFASEIGGVMHACGHDAHTAMLVGAARLLARRRHQMIGRVVFAFQPGEEGYAGARMMIEEGLLEAGGTPDAAFAIHISAVDPSGEVATRPGPLMAGVAVFKITIRGRGGHPAAPHLAIDPIPIASEIVLALQAHVARRVDVADPAVVTVAFMQAGAPTVAAIPDTATLAGSIRAISETTRARVVDGLRRVAETIASAHNAEAEVTTWLGYPSLINDAAIVKTIGELTRSVLGPQRFRILAAPDMASEDFSYILQRIPGAMVFLGARRDAEAPAEDVHSPRMVLDEEAMAAGVAFHAAVALHVLLPSVAAEDGKLG